MSKPKNEQPEQSRNGASVPRAANSGGVDARPTPPGEIVNSASQPFELERLRLPQDCPNTIGVRRRLVAIPVRKPQAQEFIRVLPEQQLATALLEVKNERDGYYLVDPDIRDEIRSECRWSCLVLAVNRLGSAFLWPLRLPNDERRDLWASSALEAAQLGQKRWVRVRADMSSGAYAVFEAVGELGEPAWPDKSFQELVKLAFRDRHITSLDHPALRKLRGEL